MEREMKVKGQGITKADNGETLFKVIFEDGAEEKEWVPKWSEVRLLVRNAVLTELLNRRWNDQMKYFRETAHFITAVCNYAEAVGGLDENGGETET